MQILDDDLERLLKNDVIDPEDAYFKASDKRRFAKYVENRN